MKKIIYTCFSHKVIPGSAKGLMGKKISNLGPRNKFMAFENKFGLLLYGFIFMYLKHINPRYILFPCMLKKIEKKIRVHDFLYIK